MTDLDAATDKVRKVAIDLDRPGALRRRFTFQTVAYLLVEVLRLRLEVKRLEGILRGVGLGSD